MSSAGKSADQLVDSFVTYLNGAGFEPKLPDQIPEELRASTAEYGMFHWQIRTASSNPWVEKLVEKLPQNWPKSFRSLIDRYRFCNIEATCCSGFLLVEAAQVTVRSQAEWRSTFFHLAMRCGRKIAKVAMARKLAVHLYWMWRQGCDYGQLQKFGSHAGEPGNPDGVQ